MKTRNKLHTACNSAAIVLAIVFLMPAGFQSVLAQSAEPVAVEETTPDAGISWLIDQVNVLIAEGTLEETSNACRHLLHYLDRAMGTYENGLPANAARHMGTFIQKVERLLRAHRIDADFGRALIDKAHEVIAALQGDAEAAKTRFATSDSDMLEGADATAALESNSPNPFNPTTTIHFTMSESATVRLTVYDMLGREVQRLVDGVRDAGPHSVVFDAQNLPSGTYLYRLDTPHGSFSKTMLLLK